jgi:hypothetical protein
MPQQREKIFFHLKTAEVAPVCFPKLTGVDAVRQWDQGAIIARRSHPDFLVLRAVHQFFRGIGSQGPPSCDKL